MAKQMILCPLTAVQYSKVNAHIRAVQEGNASPHNMWYINVNGSLEGVCNAFREAIPDILISVDDRLRIVIENPEHLKQDVYTINLTMGSFVNFFEYVTNSGRWFYYHSRILGKGRASQLEVLLEDVIRPTLQEL